MSGNGWKADVRERDCYTCQICGSHSNLSVHHKVPVARGGRSNTYNGVCWCSNCHRLYHQTWGLSISDDYGNPTETKYKFKASRKRKQKQRKKKKRQAKRRYRKGRRN